MSRIRPRKDLGQNFLTDASIRDKIVEAASVSPLDIVIEIGPGKGVLTFPLAEKALSLLAVEIDERFCGYLREKLGHAAHVEVRHADFLSLNLEEEIARLRERFPQTKAVKIVSNLPFYITTPLITKIIKNRSLITFCLVTVQKEVAERYTADPGSKRYGAITLFLNYHAKLRILFPIPKEAFRPRPEVDSAVVSITPRGKPGVEVKDEKLFFRVIRTAFQQRRKMLRNSLRSLGLPETALENAFEETDLESSLRPERLSMADFAKLSDSLSVAQGKGAAG